jgi:transaldolase
MASLLEQLSSMTVVVADTGDLEAIRDFQPRDATTNPSLILAAAQIPAYQDLIDQSLKSSRERIGSLASSDEVVSEAIDEVCVIFGKEILKIIPGRVSTEVDARLSFDKDETIDKARKIINLYKQSGISKERILIKIASTWEGVKAAEILEKEGIHCNLTLLFGFSQAIACAEAGVTLISPFVGRILDWYKSETGKESYSGNEDPGVISVSKIYNYYKTHNYKTEVMGASFRNVDEILELAGCDLLTISPKFLKELENNNSSLTRKLDPLALSGSSDKIHLNEVDFKIMLKADRMASEKLQEGIVNFSKAIEQLEIQLKERLCSIESDTEAVLSAR